MSINRKFQESGVMSINFFDTPRLGCTVVNGGGLFSSLGVEIIGDVATRAVSLRLGPVLENGKADDIEPGLDGEGARI